RCAMRQGCVTEEEHRRARLRALVSRKAKSSAGISRLTPRQRLSDAPERRRSVDQMRPAFARPGFLIPTAQRIQLLRPPNRLAGPSHEGRPAPDHVDRALTVFVLVVEITPERIVGIEPPDRLERKRLHAPGLERVVIVRRTLDVDLHAVAELADVLVKRRLEPA